MATMGSATTPSEMKFITFQDVQEQYVQDNDIFVVYKTKKNFSFSGEDWVGLFPSTWSTLEDLIAKQHVPKPTKRNKKIKHKGVLIPAEKIKVESDETKTYQFVYVTKDKRVVGLSNAFTFLEDNTVDEEPPDKAVLQLVEGPQLDNDVKLMDRSPQDAFLDFFMPDLMVTASGTTFLSQLGEDPVTSTDAVDGPVPDFTITPSGTAFLNQFDLLMDLDLKSYLENEERALLPLNTGENCEESLWKPWCAPEPEYQFAPDLKKENNWLEALANIFCNPSPQPTLNFELPSPELAVPKANSMNYLKNDCQKCKAKQQELRTLKNKSRRYKKNMINAKNELKEAKDSLLNKEVILDQVSHQLNQAVHHEKNDLLIVNDEKHYKLSHLSCQCDLLQNDLMRVNRENKQNKYKIKNLEEDIVMKNGQKENLDVMLKMSKVENQLLQKKNCFLEDDLSETKTHCDALESRLDDVMYTLSILGYTRMVDPDGTVTDLTKKTGSQMELHGWFMSTNKREEKNMKSLANKEEEITNLKNDIHDLKYQLASREQEIECYIADMGDTFEINTFLMDKLDELADELFAAAEKEATLFNQLVEERRTNWMLQFQNADTSADVKDVATNTSKSSEKVKLGSQFSSDTTADRYGSGWFSTTDVNNNNKPVQGVDSGLLQGNVLTKLFKGNETNQLKPQLSAILQGKVLTKLFQEPKNEPSPKGSSVFKNNVLKNLFKKSVSNMSVSPQGSSYLFGQVLPNLFRENSFANMPTPQGSECFFECSPKTVASSPKDSNPSLTNVQGFPPYNLKTMLKLNHQLSSGYLAYLDGGVLPKLFQEEETTPSTSQKWTSKNNHNDKVHRKPRKFVYSAKSYKKKKEQKHY